MKTHLVKDQDIKREWLIIDAKDKVLGRLAAQTAHILRGKHKPEFSPHQDVGDYVVIINAADVAVTGNKREQKNYYHHTGFPGGIKSINFDKLMAKKPTKALEDAIKGMLPKNTLGRAMFKKLKVYAGDVHPHGPQKPRLMTI